MKLDTIRRFAETKRPDRRSFLFVARREFRDLWEDLRLNHRSAFKTTIPTRRLTRIQVNQLVVIDAETDDMAIVREANRMAQSEYDTSTAEKTLTGLVDAKGQPIYREATA